MTFEVPLTKNNSETKENRSKNSLPRSLNCLGAPPYSFPPPGTFLGALIVNLTLDPAGGDLRDDGSDVIHKLTKRGCITRAGRTIESK
jgi:hypothetical protein